MKALRIDKLLWHLRLAKSRTLAQKWIEQGHIRLEGARVSGASTLVTPGQIIAIAANDRFRVVRVERIAQRRGPASEAQACYTELVASQPIDGAQCTN